MKNSLLITGGTGLLGRNWAATMRDRFAVVLGTHEREVRVAGAASRRVDLASCDDIWRAIDDTRASALIHAAGMTSVEACERNPALARHVNVELSRNVAHACSSAGIPLVHISTDHLFSSSRRLVSETEPVAPMNVYALTKADAEVAVQQAHPAALVIRTNFFGWGPPYRPSFSDVIVAAVRSRTPSTLFGDVFFTPILMENLVHAVHDLIGLRAAGVFNVVGDERISKYEFGRKIAASLQLDDAVLSSGRIEDRRDLVKRPREMSLSNEKLRQTLGRHMGDIDEQLQRLFLQERQGLAQQVQDV
jgi:dTDP-4-dehydrorhamnose reductase